MPQRQYPQVFCSFDGKIEINGKYRKYWIQDATEDMFSEIMENLTERFIGDEPTTKYLSKFFFIALSQYKLSFVLMINGICISTRV